MEIMVTNKGTIDPLFWNGKKVFLTGHTGFKGGWLSLMLQNMGAQVKGYALKPNTTPSLFNLAKITEDMDSEFGDILNLDQLSKSIKAFNPEVLIHMAAQPLVRLSYHAPLETFSTNVIGTANVLEAARSCNNLKAIISVTTDKCYENKEWEWGYRENEPLGGHDPYSSSKACAELVTAAYRNSFYGTSNTASVASVRAGNVIGGGDWSEDRLIPDILKAFEASKPVIIRNPLATRPWQHVIEPISGYLLLAQHLYNEGDKFAEAWNFGPKDEDCMSVESILNNMVLLWGEKASWKLDKNNNPHEAKFLKLDCSKANQRLNWQPKWHVNEALNHIINWHKAYLSGGNLKQECLSNIKLYMK